MEGNSGRQNLEAAKLKGMWVEQSEGMVGSEVELESWGISAGYYII